MTGNKELFGFKTLCWPCDELWELIYKKWLIGYSSKHRSDQYMIKLIVRRCCNLNRWLKDMWLWDIKRQGYGEDVACKHYVLGQKEGLATTASLASNLTLKRTFLCTYQCCPKNIRTIPSVSRHRADKNRSHLNYNLCNYLFVQTKTGHVPFFKSEIRMSSRLSKSRNQGGVEVTAVWDNTTTCGDHMNATSSGHSQARCSVLT